MPFTEEEKRQWHEARRRRRDGVENDDDYADDDDCEDAARAHCGAIVSGGTGGFDLCAACDSRD